MKLPYYGGPPKHQVSKISHHSSKDSVSNEFDMLQIAGMKVQKTKVGPKKSHKPLKK